jgi:hypothetical protein
MIGMKRRKVVAYSVIGATMIGTGCSLERVAKRSILEERRQNSLVESEV